MRFAVQLPRSLGEGLAGQKTVEKPMLFVFDRPEVRSMWMKGMLVPIDIVWADEHGNIVKVYSNVQPVLGPKYSSIKPAKYAIECAAGDAARLGLAEGSHIRIFGDVTNVD
jgi:uncharacterized membrane protein (UPF0127 family)